MQRRKVAWLGCALGMVWLGGCGEVYVTGDAGHGSGNGNGDADPASDLAVFPDTLTFNGTLQATLELEADGAWTVDADEPWLAIAPSEGVGDATLAVAVDRRGLEVAAYQAEIIFQGQPGISVSVPTLMRFPSVTGGVVNPDGKLHAASASTPAPRLPGVDYAPGEILVALDREMVALEMYGRFGAPVAAEELKRSAENLARHVGATAERLVSPSLALVKLRVGSDDVTEMIAALGRNGRVRYAEPNLYSQPAGTSSLLIDDDFGELLWNQDAIDLDAARSISRGYEALVVASIDADFHPNHPNLDASMLRGWNFADDTDDVLILNPACGSHGTHNAGTIVSSVSNESGFAGIAPQVRLLPLNTGPRPADDPNGTCITPSALIVRATLFAAGIEDSAAGQLERPVEVINFGSISPSASEAQRDAMQLARDAGVVLVAAAGNRGEGEIAFPAALPEVIAVSATDQFNELAPYSNVGSQLFLAAPGGNTGQVIGDTEFPAGILSTSWNYSSNAPAFTFLQGTTLAAAHVSGVVALMRSVNPNLTPARVEEILASSATDLGDEGSFGNGLVHAGLAASLARDGLLVEREDIVVRAFADDSLVAEANLTSSGRFDLGPLAAGTYKLVAGNLRDGEQGVTGTLYGELDLVLGYEGDRDLEIEISDQP